MSDLLDDVTAAAGLTVFGAASVAGAIGTRTLPDWSPDYDVAPRVAALRTELRALGLDHVVLLGDGAPARAAEAITGTLGVPLTVLSGTDPHGVAAALADRLRRTVLVLTSTSPTSVSLAVDSHRRAYLQAFEDNGIHDLGRRFVFVTVPGSPLATTALEMGAQLFLAQPGPLSAFALVPAGLAGADVGELVEQAFALAEPPRRRSAPAGFALPATGFTPSLPTARTGSSAGVGSGGTTGAGTPGSGATGAGPARSGPAGAVPAGAVPAAAVPVGSMSAGPGSAAAGSAAAGAPERFEHPAVALGAALAAGVAAGRDKLALAPDGSGIVGLGEWIAALLTAAGSRAVPVVLDTPGSWGHEGPDVLSVTTGGALVPGVMPGGGIAPDLAVNGPLGAQLLAWEQALTVAGLIGAAPTGIGIPRAGLPGAGSAVAGFSGPGSTGFGLSGTDLPGAGPAALPGAQPAGPPGTGPAGLPGTGPAGPPGTGSAGLPGTVPGDEQASQEGVLRMLDIGPPPQAPAFVDGAVEVHGDVRATTLIGALDEFARTVRPGATLAVHAHLDRTGDATAPAVRTGLAGRVAHTVTFAWGGGPVRPATGVAGPGGTPDASVIQITGAAADDPRVPGRPYTFGELQAAEAADDRQVLLDRGLPLLRLHLTDRNSGIDQLLAALGG